MSSISNLHPFIESCLKEFNIPGLALGMIRKDQILLSEGFGFRDLETKAPVNENTVFPIGSCTKAFTAFICLKLVQQNFLSLENPVSQYLPEFKLDSITVRDLLAHRTKIRRNDPIWFSKELSVHELPDVLNQLAKHQEKSDHFEYNNYAYALIDLLIERITEKNWSDHLDEMIFKPLNMKKTYTSIETLLKKDNVAYPYAFISKRLQKVPYRNLHALAAAGGINSNLVDLSKWLKLHLEGQESFKELYQPQTQMSTSPTPGQHTHYGLGWMIHQVNEFKEIEHSGVIDGFYSKISFFPEKDLGLIFLTNSSSQGRLAIEAIKNFIIEQLFQVEKKPTFEEIKAQYTKSQTLSQIPLSSNLESSEEYLGIFENPVYGKLHITKSKTGLHIQYGKIDIEVTFKEKDLFMGKIHTLEIFGVSQLLDFQFIRDSNGSISEIAIPFETFRGYPPISFYRACT